MGELSSIGARNDYSIIWRLFFTVAPRNLILYLETNTETDSYSRLRKMSAENSEKRNDRLTPSDLLLLTNLGIVAIVVLYLFWPIVLVIAFIAGIWKLCWEPTRRREERQMTERELFMKQSYLAINEVKRLAEDRGGSVATEDYRGEDHPLMWYCSQTHAWGATPRVTRAGQWCPYCEPETAWSGETCDLAQCSF